MDQASAWPADSCARNPAVPRTSPSWRLSEGQSQIVVPPRDGLAPQFGPHSDPVHIAPRPSSPALCRSDAKGYLLPDFYSGATEIPRRFSEGLLLRRVQMALLGVRRRLVDMRVEIDGQIRGILKTFGLVVGSGNKGAFAQRARMLAQNHPVLSALIDKLIEVREVAVAKVAALDKEIRRFVRNDLTLRRFMTVPGVGPVTALAFRSTIDEPNRFKRARDVGPYLGLTPRRYQSGVTDRHGGISKCGDRFTRTCLYEAASVLLTKVQRWSPLKAWGTRLARRIGSKKARVAIARKIGVILRCIWTDGTEFWWTKETATAWNEASRGLAVML